MERRCQGLALILALTFSPGSASAAQPRAERPNVLFFLVDDLGMMDIGANNPGTFYETPNIDRLAAQGMRFRAGYAACPVCSPTRASIQTGKYPQRVGITDYINVGRVNQPENWKRPTALLPAPYEDRLALGELTMAESFREAGYATFFAGKWHLGPEGFLPEDQGFDINKGGTAQGGPSGGGKYFSPYRNPKLTDGPPGEHLPDRLATETVRFVEDHRDRPFLAFLSFYSVHTPLMARPDLQAKYEAKARANPASGPAWGQERASKVRVVQDHAVYAGMVEAMDQAVGKVLDGLDRAGLADRILVVFTSDNGGLSTSEGHPTSNLPFRGGKGWPYEGGVRVPWIVRAPGTTAPGSTCDVPVGSVDFLPTLLDLACLPSATAPIDGQSLRPLLKGEPLDRGPLFWHYPHYGNQGGAPCGAVRDGDWKLIEWYGDGAVELYNLSDDPGERNDLADREPARRDALLAKLKAWRASVGGRMPTSRESTRKDLKR